MSLLPTATYAGATEEFWAQAGSAGSPAGVTRILAGTNVTIFPTSGEGEVTINAAGGGGGGDVTSVTASGPGISASPTTGAVILTNTGVTSVAAGAGMTVSAPTGDLTVTNSGVTSLLAGPGIGVSGGTGAVTVSTVGLPVFTGLQTFTYNGGPGSVTYTPTGNAFKILFQRAGGNDVFVAAPSGWRTTSAITLSNPSWNENTFVMVQIGGAIGFLSPPGISTNYCGGTASCGRSPGTPATERSLVVAGSGPAPSDIGFGGTFGDSFLYCLVFQAAP